MSSTETVPRKRVEGGFMPEDYDIVADRRADDRFTVRRWIRGELVKIDGYADVYSEAELLQRLKELRPSGTTWVRDSPVLQPEIFRLVE